MTSCPAPGRQDRHATRPRSRLGLVLVVVPPRQALRAEQPGAVTLDKGVLQRVGDRLGVDVQLDLLEHQGAEHRVVAPHLRRRIAGGVVDAVAHRLHGQLPEVGEQRPLLPDQARVLGVHGGQERRTGPSVSAAALVPSSWRIAARWSFVALVRPIVDARGGRRARRFGFARLLAPLAGIAAGEHADEDGDDSERSDPDHAVSVRRPGVWLCPTKASSPGDTTGVLDHPQVWPLTPSPSRPHCERHITLFGGEFTWGKRATYRPTSCWRRARVPWSPGLGRR